ncbi:MAG: arginine--tRNA ligase [Candidatus Limnocylindrales bacterium]|jgi:arginyl-tRNA synthetase
MTHDATASLRSQVREAIESAWGLARADLAPAGEASAAGGGAPPAAGEPPAIADAPVTIERPADPSFGDFASNIALKLAKPYRRAPMDIAKAISAHVVTAASDPASPIVSVEVAPPGFLNVRVADGRLAAMTARILSEPGTWGHVAAEHPEHINVEFVSANPTGPLHIGNARGAFTGDLLCRVLAAAGHKVEREYYFNDFGSQVKNLGASVVAIRENCDIPEDGYRGDYVYDMARELPASVLEEAARTGEEPAWAVGRWASERVRAGIEASLDHLGCHFDVWRSESTLHDDGWVARAVDRLRAAGDVYEEHGAVVFRSTKYGDDKDRVILRSTEDAAPTYFAADIGYLVEKFSRGYQRIVFIWGEDHHGYVARVKAAAQSLGFDRDQVQMILTAWVRFVRDGKEIAMSKRSGEFITLDELLGEIGVDAARWFFASRAASSGIDFDIELAKKQSSENPVYYVQYAHARIASILRKAEEAGMAAPAGDDPRLPGLLTAILPGAPEAQLARQIVRLPEVVEDAAASEETHGITAYATELATTFHAFYRDARVIDEAEPDRSAARLALVAAARTTLANALALLGISSPETM